MVEITVLGSGSKGNAVVIRHQDDSLLVDAGFSAAELERRLEETSVAPKNIAAILISHEHDDHIQGLRVFAKRHGNIPVYANSLTAERLRLLNKAPAKLTVFANGTPFGLGAFQIEAFSICHDAVDPVGFLIRCQGRQIGIATDFGYAGQLVPLKLRNCHALILESNHDPEMLRQSDRPAHLQHRILSRRGHLSNEDAMALLERIVGVDTRHLVMAHLSEECNRPDLVLRLVNKTLKSLQRTDVQVTVAQQDNVGQPIVV